MAQTALCRTHCLSQPAPHPPVRGGRGIRTCARTQVRSAVLAWEDFVREDWPWGVGSKPFHAGRLPVYEQPYGGSHKMALAVM